MVYRQVIVLMKRTFLLLLSLCIVCSTVIFSADRPAVSAESAVLYDPFSDTILYGKDASTARGMASTTKIMTAIVALEQYDLTQIVSVKPQWCGIEGSSMYLKPGEQVTVLDLLYGLLLVSGNDAAVALAGLHPDGEVGFVAEMNRKASELGLTNTHFDNPSGLDGKTHYTTAHELAKLTAYCMQNESFAEIVQTKSIEVADRHLANHNRLLNDIGACGVKTGFTKSCGRCLVSAKIQNDRLLICVTLNAPNDWEDHKSLYTYGFSQYTQIELLGAGDCGSCPLVSSEKDASRLYCNESFSVWLTETELDQITVALCGPRFVYGSVWAGKWYGSLQVRLNQKILFETPVYFAQTSQETDQSVSLFAFLKNYLLGEESRERTTSKNLIRRGNLLSSRS